MPATGRIVQVTGPVVDIEFPPDQLPEIFNAVVISMEGSVVSSASNRIICEVQQHLGNDWVRAVSMTSTDGIKRGMSAVDTGAPIQVPVGNVTLGRIFNVTGDPIDERGPVQAETYYPIH